MKFWCSLVVCILVSFSVWAQRNPMFYREIQLKHKPYTLQSITEEIQIQSGISFSYDADKISPDTKIKLKDDKLTVAAILAVIKKKTDIGYKIISDNHIIYTEPGQKHLASKKAKEKQPKQVKNKTVKQKPTVAKREPESIKQYHIAHTSFITEDAAGDDATIVIIGDSNAVSTYYLNGGTYTGMGGGGGGGNAGSGIDESDVKNDIGDWESEIADRRITRSSGPDKEAFLNFFKSHMLFSAGLSADEIYYCNPTMRVGFSFLYGTVSYNVGSPNSWRIGLGSSVRINEKWSVHFNYSTGPYIPKDYTVAIFDTIPPVDSAQGPTITETDKPLLVSSKLTRYGLSFNYNLGKGFSIEGAATLNYMKTNYSSNSNPVTFSEFLPFGVDADSKYYSIKPPYVLGNTYSANQSSNTKTWIGIQVSLFYSLGFLER